MFNDILIFSYETQRTRDCKSKKSKSPIQNAQISNNSHIVEQYFIPPPDVDRLRYLWKESTIHANQRSARFGI